MQTKLALARTRLSELHVCVWLWTSDAVKQDYNDCSTDDVRKRCHGDIVYSFDTVHNLDLYGCEFAPTVREGMRAWNMTVQYWLATYVYKRLPFRTSPLRLFTLDLLYSVDVSPPVYYFIQQYVCVSLICSSDLMYIKKETTRIVPTIRWQKKTSSVPNVIHDTLTTSPTEHVRPPPSFCSRWFVRLEQSSGPCPQSELHRSCFQAPAKDISVHTVLARRQN